MKKTYRLSLITNDQNTRANKFWNRFVFGVESYKPSVISSSRAFTLVELLIAIGLFSIVITIAMGGFVRALRSQRQVVALIAANSNVSLVMEQMSREMRTGYYFCEATLITPCTSDNSNISFLNGKGENIVYYSEASPSGNGRIFRAVNGGQGSQLTADNVNIRNLKFNLLGGVNDPPNYPARVVIRASVSPAGNSFNVSDVVTSIQTSVSTRGFGS
jgi:prepilin-type N-terminal cleavage/methylation domain-containing protein